MAPNTELFPASDLSHHLKIVHDGFKPKRRKGKQLDPFQCPLYELQQYSCHPVSAQEIHCMTILRLFRKYVQMILRSGSRKDGVLMGCGP